MGETILVLFTVAIFLVPIIILPLTVDYYHPPKEVFSQLVIIFCLMLWLIQGVRKGRLEIVENKLYLFLLLFCIISGLSLIWAQSRYLGLRDYVQLLTYIGAFFICVNIVSRQREAVSIAKFAFIAGLISAAYATLQYFGFDFIRYPDANFSDWRFRLYSTFGNPDFLANYLILIFPVGVAFYLSAENLFKKVLLLLALVTIYYALLVTFSVGALLGLLFAVVFGISLFIVESIRLRSFICRRDFISYLVVLVIVLGLVSISFPSLLKRAKSSVAWRYGLDNRMMTYRTAYRMIRDNPVRGVGIGNFKLRFPEYRGRILSAQQKYFDSLLLDKERDRHVHNDLAQAWVETGFFGFVVFAAILVIIFKNGAYLYLETFDYNKKLFVLGLLCGIVAFLVHSLVSFPLHVMSNGLLFWTFVGLLFTQGLRQETTKVILNIEPTQKRFFETGMLIAALLLCIWPIRIYLSQVFLKRMVGFDRQGLIQDALVEAETSLFFDPNSNSIVYVGNYATLTNNYGMAVQSYIKALRNNNEINYHIALAESYYKDGLVRDCISEYMKAVLLNPYSMPMHLRLAELYADNNMYNEAASECQFLLMHNSDDEDIKKRLTPIIHKIFEEQLLSTYHGQLPIEK